MTYLHGYDTQFSTEGNMKHMYLITYASNKKCMLEKLSKFSSRLHYTYINVIESHMVVKEDPHMRNIIENLYGHILKGQWIL